MAQPNRPNATCDIYRTGTGPPAAPAVAGVSFFLREQAEAGLEHYESSGPSAAYTHVGNFELSVDVRHAAAGPWAAGDTLYVPDQNGSPFQVLAVVRAGRGTSVDHKKVFLRLGVVTWPTSEL